MYTYNVAESFISINGEGKRAGELSLFIRFKGCNLNCSYCDTSWANRSDCPSNKMSLEEIIHYIKSSGVRNITLTGGEPLIQAHIAELINEIMKDSYFRVEIETNGAVNILPFTKGFRPVFTMDYKLPDSGMEQHMNLENFELLCKNDSVKFVVSSRNDLERALYIIKQYDLTKKATVFFSPVFGRINPVDIVSFMTENKLNDIKLQLQIHKIIWNPNQRGV